MKGKGQGPMMNRRLEIRGGKLFTVQPIDETTLEHEVARGWYTLFTDASGVKRFGYILSIDHEQQQVVVLDAVRYPNAPGPIGVQGEPVPFAALIIASTGFNWLRQEQVRKLGRRDIAFILQGSERDATVGWVRQRGGRCAYV